MARLYSSTFTDAHCEFFQMLLTTGIVGTAGYFGILLTNLTYGFKNHRCGVFAFSGFILLGAYLCQGLVNNPQIAVTPIFFVLLGLSAAEISGSGSVPTSPSTKQGG